MHAPKPTIYDVAHAAGVSKSLVSLVLQGSPRVSEHSRRRVEAAIRDLGYRPSRAAANLAAGSTRTVGVLIDDYTNLWFVELVRGLHDVLGRGGYRLSVVDVATASQAEDPVEGLLSMRVDGVILGMDVPEALTAPGGPPVVIAGTRSHVSDGIDVVANDDALGGRLAAEHATGLRHRNLAHLAAGGGAALARRHGFLQRAQADGIPVIIGEYSGPASEEAGFESAMRLLEDHPETTAIFGANDLMAVGALGAARRLGLDVPRRLSVIGYDNSSLARTRLVDLTTIDDNSFAVGQEAARLLLERMRGEADPPHHLKLAPHLVRRGTTAIAAKSLLD